MKPTTLPSALLIPLWVLFLLLSISAQAVSSSAAPRTPSGASPAEALAVTCNWESLPPTSHVWYQWPRSDDDLLHLQLMSYPETLKGMEFRVYAAQPEGNTGDPSSPARWGMTKSPALVSFENAKGRPSLGLPTTWTSSTTAFTMRPTASARDSADRSISKSNEEDTFALRPKGKGGGPTTIRYD